MTQPKPTKIIYACDSCLGCTKMEDIDFKPKEHCAAYRGETPKNSFIDKICKQQRMKE